jgi:hypothetical protein
MLSLVIVAVSLGFARLPPNLALVPSSLVVGRRLWLYRAGPLAMLAPRFALPLPVCSTRLRLRLRIAGATLRLCARIAAIVLTVVVTVKRMHSR